MTDGSSKYYSDKYYINKMINNNAWHRRDKMVSKLHFFLVKLFNKNKYNIYGNNKNVLYEKGGKIPDTAIGDGKLTNLKRKDYKQEWKYWQQ